MIRRFSVELEDGGRTADGGAEGQGQGRAQTRSRGAKSEERGRVISQGKCQYLQSVIVSNCSQQLP